jgi:NRAMP (natural resistance-associated macrophage protein)-like metal ion transporter
MHVMLKKIPFKVKLFLSVIGPGIVVMLADTDASSIITAAQTGAIWAYKMILLQIILIPILYITQELTVRLGIVTKMGHGELIKQQFGKFWAWFSITTLTITCIGAIIGQFVGLAGVGMLFGIPSWITMIIATIFLMIVVLTGSYRSVERCAILIGLFELVFVVVAWLAHPSIKEILHGLTYFPIHNSSYLYLAAANIGAVIMPWMIFYQQSAIVDKGLDTKHIKISRYDTAIGAVVTQVIMISVIITIAATIGKTNPGTPLKTVHQISEAITPYLGTAIGHLCFALGMIGASLVAAIVVSLTAAWGLGEITGFKHSLEHKPKDAPWFYVVYCATLILGFILIESGINLVDLSVAINVMNALLLPIVLAFLYLLALKALPDKYRLKGVYAWSVGIVLFITAAFGVIAAISGILW